MGANGSAIIPPSGVALHKQQMQKFLTVCVRYGRFDVATKKKKGIISSSARSFPPRQTLLLPTAFSLVTYQSF